MVLLCIKQVLINGDKLCRVYNPDYLGDDGDKKIGLVIEKDDEEGREGGARRTTPYIATTSQKMMLYMRTV